MSFKIGDLVNKENIEKLQNLNLKEFKIQSLLDSADELTKSSLQSELNSIRKQISNFSVLDVSNILDSVKDLKGTNKSTDGIIDIVSNLIGDSNFSDIINSAQNIVGNDKSISGIFNAAKELLANNDLKIDQLNSLLSSAGVDTKNLENKALGFVKEITSSIKNISPGNQTLESVSGMVEKFIADAGSLSGSDVAGFISNIVSKAKTTDLTNASSMKQLLSSVINQGKAILSFDSPESKAFVDKFSAVANNLDITKQAKNSISGFVNDVQSTTKKLGISDKSDAGKFINGILGDAKKVDITNPASIKKFTTSTYAKGVDAAKKIEAALPKIKEKYKDAVAEIKNLSSQLTSSKFWSKTLDDLKLLTADSALNVVPSISGSSIEKVKDLSPSKIIKSPLSTSTAQPPKNSSLTKGFERPWDLRFKFSYSDSQQIGNKMPKGPDFYGSSSLMNEFVLIRFGHIAGQNHHKMLIDQEGSPGFSSIGKTITFTKTENGVAVSGTNSLSDKTTSTDLLDKANGNTTDSFINNNDSAYQAVENMNIEIWVSDVTKTSTPVTPTNMTSMWNPDQSPEVQPSSTGETTGNEPTGNGIGDNVMKFLKDSAKSIKNIVPGNQALDSVSGLVEGFVNDSSLLNVLGSEGNQVMSFVNSVVAKATTTDITDIKSMTALLADVKTKSANILSALGNAASEDTKNFVNKFLGAANSMDVKKQSSNSISGFIGAFAAGAKALGVSSKSPVGKFIDEVLTGAKNTDITKSASTTDLKAAVVKKVNSVGSSLVDPATTSYNSNTWTGNGSNTKIAGNTITINVKPGDNARPGLKGPATMQLSTANVEEYWLKEKGWIKCETNGVVNYYPDGRLCQKAKDDQENANSFIAIAPEELATLELEMEDMKKEILSRLEENWYFKEYQKDYVPIEQTNNSPTLSKIIEPTFENLCDAENWQDNPQFAYQWKDLLYTKDYAKIPNNRMITLRRFSMPVNDSGKLHGSDFDRDLFQVPVASAIAWYGDGTGNTLGEMLGMSYNLEWAPIDSEEMQNDNEIDGNEASSSTGPFDQVAKKLFDFNVVTSGGQGASNVSGEDAIEASEWKEKYDPYSSGKYVNKIFGPVNRITKTYARKAGIDYTQTFNVTFTYELKSIGGINPKAAMLDILADILALTYTDADFWGGDIRYFPQHPQYPFMGGKKAQEAFFSGDPSTYIDAIATKFTEGFANLGETLSGMLSDPAGTISKLASGAGKLWMAKKVQSRPNILAIKSLLTGEPVGEWHLVIGNPFNPIEMIGNLIVTKTQISFSEDLGIDDFPETMTVTVSLDHGMPRDKGAIENMFNRGLGKLHWGYEGQATEKYNQTVSSTDMSNILGKRPTTYVNAHTGKRESISNLMNTNDQDTLNTNKEYTDEVKQTEEVLLPRIANANETFSGYKKAAALSEKVAFKRMGE